MKILIFASCSKTKSIKYPHQPTCNEIKSKEIRESYLQQFPEKKQAADLYRGALNITTTGAVNQLREFFDVSYYIISAGFGILHEKDLVPPYECSFSEMSKQQIEERANLLKIPEDYQKIIENEKPELIFLCMGIDYLYSLGEWDKNLPCKTIAFDESISDKVISLPADHIAVKEVSNISGLPIHGIVGFKGDLLLLTTRYLKNHKDPVKALRELLDNPYDLIYTINTLREHT
ncbi:MAG: hypothetical protein JXA54_16160 [Candidatus Heimdallarchaeota archaeon]|nr:hypothetical protein [Candidatus Heimdallarchaeota archaeon]